MSCQGKVAYATEREAQIELVGVIIARNRGKSKRRECRHYYCDRHRCWHLTSLPRWEDRKGACPPPS